MRTCEDRVYLLSVEKLARERENKETQWMFRSFERERARARQESESTTRIVRERATIRRLC